MVQIFFLGIRDTFEFRLSTRAMLHLSKGLPCSLNFLPDRYVQLYLEYSDKGFTPALYYKASGYLEYYTSLICIFETNMIMFHTS